MPRQKSIRNILRNWRPGYYSKPFHLASRSHKSTTIANIHEMVNFLSGGDPQSPYDYLVQSQIGKRHIPYAQIASKTPVIVNRIKKLFSNIGRGYKANILSLVVGWFGRNTLGKMAFRYSNRQEKAALLRVHEDNFTLQKYVPVPPRSLRIVTEQTKDLIIDFLKLHSRISALQDENGQDTYHLQHSKKFIYVQFCKEHPTRKISLSTFYKYCPKWFKKPIKYTDMCAICVNGEKLKNTVEHLRQNAQPVCTKLEEDLLLYEQHTFFKARHKELYDNTLRNLADDSCVVIMDFKQNFQVRIGRVEATRNFCNRTDVSVLGMAILYKDKDGILKKRYVDYFSKVLTHDSKFVVDCLQMLADRKALESFTHIFFYSDTARHFRSAELLHFVLKKLPSQLNATTVMNYFCPYHGKSIVDSHFGLLTRWLTHAASTTFIKDIQEIISYFNECDLETRELDILFHIYEATGNRGMTQKLKIASVDIYSFLTLQNGLLNGCVFPTYIPQNYEELQYIKAEETDKRRTKYAPRANSFIDEYDFIMGPRASALMHRRAILAEKLDAENV